MLSDLRYAIRTLLKQPGFALVAMVVVALGIGVNLAVFGIVDALLLRTPALVRQPDEIVRITRAFDDRFGSMRYPDYAFIRDNNGVFSGVIAYDAGGDPFMLRSGRHEEQIDGTFVSGNFFQVLGISPAIGRGFRPEEDAQGTVQSVALISHALWQRMFDGDRSVLDQPISLNGRPFTVIGVLPAEYHGAGIDDAPVDVYVPMWTRMELLSRPVEDFVLTPHHRHSFMTVLGRLAPGVTRAQADANLDVLARQLAAAWELDEPERMVAIPHFALNPNTRALMVRVSRMLAVVAGIILLIACANLANLQLARATVRYRELALRVALGASRGRIVRQLLTESVLLSGAGAVLAIIAGLWTTELVARLLPLSFVLEARTDWRLIAVATVIAFVTGVLSGVVPAIRASRTDVMSSVKSGGRGAIDGRSPLRGALVVTQVALSCLLLVGAGLFVRTLQRVHDVALGYEVQRGLAVSLDLRPYGYGETTGTQLYERLLDRVRALPGVRSAALGSIVPLSGAQRQSGISIEGRPPVPDEELPSIDNDLTGPGYFGTMGISIVAGRDFTGRDDRSAPRVAIVNESMARRFWPGETVLGKRFRTGNDGPWHEIVGVARDVRHVSVDEEPLPVFYRPFAQQYYARMQLFVRTGGDPLALVTPIREVVHDLAPRVTIPSIQTLAAIHSESIRTFTTNATLISALGVLALVLAAVGLYGVLAFLVAQRTREIGVRIALGARGRDVLWQVTKQGLALTALGLAIGAVAAWFLVRTVSDQLFEVTPRDPFAFGIAMAVLLAAALLASLVPARRASRVEPMEALRVE